VATDLHLLGNAGFYYAMGAKPLPTATRANESATAERDRAAELLASTVTVSLPKDSRVATISFTSGNPQLSAAVANAYAHGLIKLNLDRRFASSDYARNYLNGQVVQSRLRLESSERALNDYARSAGLINTPNMEGGTSGAPVSVTQAALLQLNQALSNARAQRIEAEMRLRASTASPLMSLPEVVNNNAVQKLLTDRAAQEVTLAETRQRYTAEHPTAIQAAARVSQIDQQLSDIASSVRRSLEMQFRAARGQEAALEGQVASLKGASLAEQDRSVQYNILRHEVDSNRSLYDLLLQRQREVATSAGVQPNNISVLDEAVAPSTPSSPKPLLNLLAGVFLGFIVGIALALLRELLDDRVRSIEEVERKLALTSLGQIPLVTAADKPALIASLDDPGSELGIHYSAFRTSLLFSTRTGLPKTVAITSSVEGEGKSTTALATARSLASAGKRVLLIEGDMRRKTITDLLHLNEEAGLSALLTGQASFDEAIQNTGVPNLDAISGGPLPPNPADILDPERLKVVLDCAAQFYDCVIVDAPPVTDLADAPLIAAAAKNVVFVVAAKSHHPGRAKAALRRLRATGATILGAVLTKAPRSGLRYYRYFKKLPKAGEPELEAA
jgi:capsular exopolysaccharide synthesis family protein